jgi:multiple sugar transport system substrate-binding protein
LPADTGIVTNFSGPSNPDGAAWADIRYFGITTDANTDVAMEFVEFSMSDGYTETLAIAPEGKFPVRNGTADNPTNMRCLGHARCWRRPPRAAG